MARLTAEGMSYLDAKKSERQEKLNTLLHEPFDHTNPQQMEELKTYIDDFEFMANQMYLFQGIGQGLYPAIGTWCSGFLLPLPEFVTYFSAVVFYSGIIGKTLQNFRENDFHNQLKEMQLIYNWSLKAGKTTYDNAIDNSSILLHPDIQRMVKILAPFCTTEFCLAWPKVTDNAAEPLGLMASLYRIPTLFSPAPQPTAAQNQVHELKMKIETRAFDLNALKAAQEAINYFAPILIAKVQGPLTTVKEFSENAMAHFTHPKKA